MNQNRREFSEYLLVLHPEFFSPKEHQTSTRDIIGGVETLMVDLLSFLEYEVSCFGKNCQPLRKLRPETGESLAKFLNHSQLPNIFILL